ncbi:hypothetical protein D3C75_927940 [compost metagenome]
MGVDIINILRPNLGILHRMAHHLYCPFGPWVWGSLVIGIARGGVRDHLAIDRRATSDGMFIFLQQQSASTFTNRHPWSTGERAGRRTFHGMESVKSGKGRQIDWLGTNHQHRGILAVLDQVITNPHRIGTGRTGGSDQFKAPFQPQQ